MKQSARRYAIVIGGRITNNIYIYITGEWEDLNLYYYYNKRCKIFVQHYKIDEITKRNDIYIYVNQKKKKKTKHEQSIREIVNIRIAMDLDNLVALMIGDSSTPRHYDYAKCLLENGVKVTLYTIVVSTRLVLL